MRKLEALIRAVITVLVLGAVVGATPAYAGSYVVNSTLDLPDAVPGDGECGADADGPLAEGPFVCTLRAAMQESNADGDASVITFAIPPTDPGCGLDGPWCTITLVRDLPTLIESDTTINGFSQNTHEGTSGSGERPGVIDSGNTCAVVSFPNPDIAINANIVSSNPFSIHGDASRITIRGLAIYNAGPFNPATMDPEVAAFATDGHAVVVLPGPGVDRFIQQNFVGLLPDGSDPGGPDSLTPRRNVEFGIRLLNPAPGSTMPRKYALEAHGNLVAYNGKGGMDSESSDTVVWFRGNEVFQNGWASVDLAHDGIDVNGHDSLAECNLSYSNTNPAGVPKGDAANGFEVGSTRADAGLDNNILRYNTSRFNLSGGFSIRKGARGNLLEKNVSHDNWVGIVVDTEGRFPTNRNTFSRNSTFRNMTIGIDLVRTRFLSDPVTGEPILDENNEPIPVDAAWVGTTDLITPNDHCDVDGGVDGDPANFESNDLQNHPILLSAMTFGSITRIQGTLDSRMNTTYLIEFFRTPNGEAGGMGPEGKHFIGQIIVTTGPDCTTSFSHDVPAQPEKDEITATARIYTGNTVPDDLWSTSEYSPAVVVNNFLPEGKVTGGGFVEPPSPYCASPCNDVNSSSTRGNFGFIAQYHKDDFDPRGHTNFVYQPGNLHFSSTDYTFASLVITRVTNPITGQLIEERATWTGEGKLNQEKRPMHCFRVNTTDRGEPGTADSFRIKIWRGLPGSTGGTDCSVESHVIFDTVTEIQLGGGNIQVHKN